MLAVLEPTAGVVTHHRCHYVTDTASHLHEKVCAIEHPRR